MEIAFRSSALKKACNDSKKGLRRFGVKRFALVRLRLDQLAASECLGDVPPPAHCHELKGKRKGELAVSLDGGWRLVFVPANDPIPMLSGGGFDRTKITAVLITEVIDYHD